MSEQTPTPEPAGSQTPPVRPSRRFGAAALVATLLVGAGAGAAGMRLLGGRGEHAHGDGAPAAAAAKPEAKKQQFICPMHPTIVMDHQGDCPLCGMKLVPMEEAGGGAKPAGERKIAFYRSPHDPNETSHEPRKDAMGMDFVPVYEDEVAGGGAKVQGLAQVAIDPQRQQLIGLRTAAAARGPVGATWRTVGRVAVDETRVHHVSVKVAGFAEHVFIDFAGKQVRRGEPLFTIYSPDLLSAQQEYLLALRMRDELSGAGGSAGGPGDDLVRAARERLRLWDIPASEIRRLEESRKPSRTLTIHSPMSGVVTKKDIVMGHRLNEGDMPYEITDLSTVWVLADVYESELSKVKVGTPAELTLQSLPGRAFKGKVVFVDPLLAKETRTAKVRLEFPNPRGELKPEMFGEVVLKSGQRQGLRIPADAVVRTGTKDVVFVAQGEGKFQPREIQLGASDGDAVEVVRGLEEGEKVVTRANFLVDSESRLRASLAAMRGE
jgi:Cu(I)/Ag(I) efflux system membrane fusion protein